MPEADRFLFELKELAEVLVEKQGISQGHWGVYIEFGLAAANIPTGPNQITPASINLVQKIGIQKFAEPNSLTVDAAEVNQGKASKKGPSQKASSKQARKK